MNIRHSLDAYGCISENKHFVYTSGKHGNSYVNLRTIAHDSIFLDAIGKTMADAIPPDLEKDNFIFLGLETLGRTLAGYAAIYKSTGAIWCKPTSDTAVFPSGLHFEDLVIGKQVVLIDDLLTTGGSLIKARELVESCGGNVPLAIVVVRRSPEIVSKTIGVPSLVALTEIAGFTTYEADDCPLCKAEVPITLHPGHGHEWIKGHPYYPVAE
jgi:orotate phosphoribosyltransferase